MTNPPDVKTPKLSELPRWQEHTGSMGSKASCLAFLAGLAEGAFMLPSALLGFIAADGLRATAGADSTAVTAPAPQKNQKGSQHQCHLCDNNNNK